MFPVKVCEKLRRIRETFFFSDISSRLRINIEYQDFFSLKKLCFALKNHFGKSMVEIIDKEKSIA